ncbi:uncharacterized protein LOC130191668 isoform X1 [Pseudoliparis swirei]|uniref:uncharacterized protein LOC130191668 isoform X1 n=2 Tax=Pseudoliparis swirei TaxID=2059687 RepID=UPI0024BE5E0E|nr:uncharacterized protein LOC130191668 isoform X1 [Pseudoliparis swirei]
MNGPLFLFYCIEILAALLCGAQNVASTANLTNSQDPAATGQKNYSQSNADAISSTSQALTPTDPTRVASGAPSTVAPPAVSQDSNSHGLSLSPSPQPTTTTTAAAAASPIYMFYKKECHPVFMTAGGLIIACTVLLTSTLLLMCTVCRLSRRIKMLSANGDLISTSEYWMGTAKRSKSEPETNANEAAVLMADIGQTQEAVGDGAAKEEAAKAKEDGRMGEEDKMEVGDTAQSGEAPATPAVGNASSSTPQEEASDAQA